MHKTILKRAAINAGLTAAYVVLVASFLYHAASIFPQKNSREVIIPIAMLLLFVFSAALTGALVFGQPISWYWDNRKQDALRLLGYTLGLLFVVVVIVFFIMYLMP